MVGTDKNDRSKHANLSKAERQYVRGIVHNLSLQRFTDQEIVHYLHEEKKIDIARSTVNGIRNQAEKEAESWYIELRESGARYIATYKQRLDSLQSYQKRIHEVINKNPNSEIVLRAISELHRIELSLHTLMKELPGDITTSKDIAKQDKEQNKKYNGHMTFDEWLENNKQAPRVMNDSDYSDEENGKYYWDLHQRYNKYVKDWGDSMFGPDTPPKSIMFEENEKAWAAANDSDSKTEIESKKGEESSTSIQGCTELVTQIDSYEEPEPEDNPSEESTQVSKSNNSYAIDLDILGRYPRPFDVKPWIQCTFQNCEKWLENDDLRMKHVAKYHTG